MASTEVERGPVDTGWKREPEDALSTRFGWHGRATRTFYIAGWFVVFSLFIMMVGNHAGHVEDIWLAVFGLGLAFVLVRGQFFSRESTWRR